MHLLEVFPPPSPSPICASLQHTEGKGGKKTKVDTAVTIVDTNADFLDQVEKERKSGGNG